MAISLNFSWRGLTIPNAYIRIDTVKGGKRENRPTQQMPGEAIWHAIAGVYANPEEVVPLFSVDIVIPFTSEVSPYPSLYAALKAAPDFAGAVDC